MNLLRTCSIPDEVSRGEKERFVKKTHVLELCEWKCPVEKSCVIRIYTKKIRSWVGDSLLFGTIQRCETESESRRDRRRTNSAKLIGLQALRRPTTVMLRCYSHRIFHSKVASGNAVAQFARSTMNRRRGLEPFWYVQHTPYTRTAN